MSKHRMLVKALGFLLVGIVIALVFTITPGTYSLYTKEYKGPTTTVEAATTKDFIKEMKIEYKGKAPFLKLKRADHIDYSPVIFFSIEGDLKDYVLHMDSVKLEKESSVPIVPNINLPQAIFLLLSREKEISGQVRIKHLNNFIDQPLKVKISKDYLLDRYFLNKGLPDSKISSLSSMDKNEMVKFLEKMISYTSPYMDWDKVLWQEDGYNIQDGGSKSLPIGKADITSNQVTIIDLVAPDLLKYNERLYSLLEILVKDLNNHIKENNILKIEKEELIDKVKELEEAIDKLEDTRTRLKIDNDELYDQVIKLRTDNDELYDEIRYLENKIKENLNPIIPVGKKEDEAGIGTVE